MVVENVLPNIDLSGYLGQWVVICNEKVVAHNKDITKIDKEIEACKKAPLVVKIPKSKTLIF